MTTREPVGRQNGAAIRALRQKDGVTVIDFARYIAVHPQTLRNIENGRRPASKAVMRDIARNLGVPIKAITRDGTDDEFADEADFAPGAELAAVS